jgi:hypothetical protein
MQGSPGSEAAAMAKERIGVLFVHGIGDQRTYEHLENEAHQIVRALKEPAGQILGLSGRSDFGVRVRTSRDAPLHAEQGLWLGEKRAPVCVDLHDHHGAPERLIEIDFHEVWWADLNEPVNLGYHARFWSCGLGQWKVKRYTRTSLEGARPRLARARPQIEHSCRPRSPAVALPCPSGLHVSASFWLVVARPARHAPGCAACFGRIVAA